MNDHLDTTLNRLINNRSTLVEPISIRLAARQMGNVPLGHVMAAHTTYTEDSVWQV